MRRRPAGLARVVLGTVLVGMRMLVIGVFRIFRVPVLVGVVLGSAGSLVVPVAMLVRMGVLVSDVLGVVRVAMFMDGVLAFGHHALLEWCRRRVRGSELPACATIYV